MSVSTSWDFEFFRTTTAFVVVYSNKIHGIVLPFCLFYCSIKCWGRVLDTGVAESAVLWRMIYTRYVIWFGYSSCVVISTFFQTVVLAFMSDLIFII